MHSSCHKYELKDLKKMRRKRDEYLLHNAVIEKDLDKVKSLIKDGWDVNETDYNHWTPLHYAAQDGLYSIAEVLISSGAEIDVKDDYGKSPLLVAAFNYPIGDSEKVIKLLLKNGADKFLKNDYGISPYSMAIDTMGGEPLVKLLDSI